MIETNFSTGATGYLGTELLRQILLSSTITKVLVYVCADSESKGLMRIIKAAKTANWWRDAFLPKLKMYLEDLSELLVKRFAACLRSSGHHISIINPSYIIGSPEYGNVNISDYLWRLVAGTITAKVVTRRVSISSCLTSNE